MRIPTKMLFLLLPMMLIKFCTKISNKIFMSVPGLTITYLLFVFNFHYTIMFFLYLYFTGDTMINRALQFNRTFRSKLGMHFAISIHAFWYLVLSTSVKKVFTDV